MVNKAIICDIDGTLASCEHRRHYIDVHDWNSFYEQMGIDSVHEWCKEIILSFHEKGYKILLVTGRPDKYMHETIFWLDKYNVPYDELFMRRTKDNHDDTIVKQEIYDKQIKGVYDVLFAIDDRQRIVDMWRRNGIICLQCAKGNF